MIRVLDFPSDLGLHMYAPWICSARLVSYQVISFPQEKIVQVAEVVSSLSCSMSSRSSEKLMSDGLAAKNTLVTAKGSVVSWSNELKTEQARCQLTPPRHETRPALRV
jgi:hypothetical protein